MLPGCTLGPSNPFVPVIVHLEMHTLRGFLPAENGNEPAPQQNQREVVSCVCLANVASSSKSTAPGVPAGQEAHSAVARLLPSCRRGALLQAARSDVSLPLPAWTGCTGPSAPGVLPPPANQQQRPWVWFPAAEHGSLLLSTRVNRLAPAGKCRLPSPTSRCVTSSYLQSPCCRVRPSHGLGGLG